MFCKNCGKQIDDSSKFCEFCGKKTYVGKDVQTETPTTSPPRKKKTQPQKTVQKPVAAKEIEDVENDYEDQYDRFGAKEVIKKICSIIGIGCLVTIVCMLLYQFYQSDIGNYDSGISSFVFGVLLFVGIGCSLLVRFIDNK